MLVAAGICLLSILVFSFIADEIVVEKKDLFDSKAFQALNIYTSISHTKIALFITFFGTGNFLIPAYLLTILYLVRRKRKKYAIMIAVIAIVSMLLGFALKEIFRRSRPGLVFLEHAGGYSFPSGHSMGGFTFSGIMIYMIWKTTMKRYMKWIFSVLLFVFALLIGLSRIYLHVHFASDVIGSFFVTLIWLSFSFISLQLIQKRVR